MESRTKGIVLIRDPSTSNPKLSVPMPNTTGITRRSSVADTIENRKGFARVQGFSCDAANGSTMIKFCRNMPATRITYNVPGLYLKPEH